MIASGTSAVDGSGTARYSATRQESVSIHNIVVLLADRLAVEMLCQVAQRVFSNISIHVIHQFDHLAAALKQGPIDLFITATALEDGDILDTLSDLFAERRQVGKVLVMTHGCNQRTAAVLNMLPVAGVFDADRDGAKELAGALRKIEAGEGYWSSTIAECLLDQFNSPDSISSQLTATEQLVLAVFGDGSNDAAAATRLAMAESTVLSVRRQLHRKLGVCKQGELVRVAAQLGFVRLRRDRVEIPGHRMLLAAYRAKCRNPGRMRCSHDPEADRSA